MDNKCFICGSVRTDEHSVLVWAGDEVIGSAHRLDYGPDIGYWRMIATFPGEWHTYFVGSCFDSPEGVEKELKRRYEEVNGKMAEREV